MASTTRTLHDEPGPVAGGSRHVDGVELVPGVVLGRRAVDDERRPAALSLHLQQTSFRFISCSFYSEAGFPKKNSAEMFLEVKEMELSRSFHFFCCILILVNCLSRA